MNRFEKMTVKDLKAYASKKGIVLGRDARRNKDALIRRILQAVPVTQPKKKVGQIVDRTHSGGLSIQEYWCKLFMENEKAWEEKRYADIKTDAELALEIRRAFPSRTSKVLSKVGVVRSRVNRGVQMSPGVFVHRYVRLEDDSVVRLRMTTRGPIEVP